MAQGAVNRCAPNRPYQIPMSTASFNDECMLIPTVVSNQYNSEGHAQIQPVFCLYTIAATSGSLSGRACASACEMVCNVWATADTTSRRWRAVVLCIQACISVSACTARGKVDLRSLPCNRCCCYIHQNYWIGCNALYRCAKNMSLKFVASDIPGLPDSICRFLLNF